MEPVLDRGTGFRSINDLYVGRFTVASVILDIERHARTEYRTQPSVYYHVLSETYPKNGHRESVLHGEGSAGDDRAALDE
jgi:hypothetical protein